MHPYEELSLLIESVEDDIARAVKSGNVAASRRFAQELRARFSIYRDACADAGIAWAGGQVTASREGNGPLVRDDRKGETNGHIGEHRSHGAFFGV